MPEAQSSNEAMGINNHFSNDSFGNGDRHLRKNLDLSCPGLNVTGSDVLSVLLEQKLQELIFRVDSSHCNLVGEETSASLGSSLQDSIPSMVSSTSREQNERFQFGIHRSKSESKHDYDFSSVDGLLQIVDRQRQVCLLCLYLSDESIILFCVLNFHPWWFSMTKSIIESLPGINC